MDSGSLRYQKNWFKKDRSAQDAMPRIHMRKVSAGMDGSSSTGTVMATCSMGEFSTSSTVDDNFAVEVQGSSSSSWIMFLDTVNEIWKLFMILIS